MGERSYVAIDLKSFYASVECMERGLDPLGTNLVVADASRTEKTICLAVSPSLKAHGISGRARLFEVVQRVKEINAERLRHTPDGQFHGSSYDPKELAANPSLEMTYVVATPQMAHYIQCSTEIYKIYLKYIAPEDIHVYSIDEVFMDVTNYLSIYEKTPEELASMMVRDILQTTGITATAGIGTNLYLCKIAMDIVAKHIPADKDGVRMATLDERTYRELLWTHQPMTDFWRVGGGTVRRLQRIGVQCMGDLARLSMSKSGQDVLYRTFGINAELLIDHAWGREPCTIRDIKTYKPMSNSLSSGQVLSCAYEWDKARLVIREMADQLSFDLLDKGVVTDQIVITVGYDMASLQGYRGEVSVDPYGRKIPKHAHGSRNLKGFTSSTEEIVEAALKLYDRIVDPALKVRRMYVVANHIKAESLLDEEPPEQLSLFVDPEEQEAERKQREREKKKKQAVLELRKKYGKNAVFKGMDLLDGATTIERNGQIGGHKA